MFRVIELFAVVVLAALLAGCQWGAEDNGKIELAFATTISIGTVTSRTDASPTATADLADWLHEPMVNRFVNPTPPPVDAASVPGPEGEGEPGAPE